MLCDARARAVYLVRLTKMYNLFVAALRVRVDKTGVLDCPLLLLFDLSMNWFALFAVRRAAHVCSFLFLLPCFFVFVCTCCC